MARKKRNYKRPDNVPRFKDDPAAWRKWYNSLYRKEEDVKKVLSKAKLKWSKKNREHLREYHRQWREANPEKIEKYNLKKRISQYKKKNTNVLNELLKIVPKD